MVEARSTLTGAEPAKCTMSDAAKASTASKVQTYVARRNSVTGAEVKTGRKTWAQTCVQTCLWMCV